MAVGRRIRSICAAAAEAGASALRTPSSGRLRPRAALYKSAAAPYKSAAARRSLGLPPLAAAPAGPPTREVKRLHALLAVEQERAADPEASWADIFGRATRRTAEFNRPSKGYKPKYVRLLYYQRRQEDAAKKAAHRKC